MAGPLACAGPVVQNLEGYLVAVLVSLPAEAPLPEHLGMKVA